MTAIRGLTCDNGADRRGAGNASTVLTHLTDLSGRGLGVSLPSEESWRAIPGYEGRYEASDQGRIRSLLTARVMSHKVDRRGYHRVCLYRDGGKCEYPVHRLVLMAFVGPPGTREVGRHLDDHRADNRLENLAWGTYRDNALDRLRNGNHPGKNRSHCKRGHLLDGDNVKITRHKTPHGFGERRRCIPCEMVRRRSICPCPICGKQMQRDYLRRHVRDQHPDSFAEYAA